MPEKVRYIGCCNFGAWQLCEALWRSDVLHSHAFSAIQNQYSLLNRWEIEPDLMPLCARYRLGIAVYSPLAIGLLTGRFRQGQPAPAGTPWADNPFHSAHFAAAMDARAEAIVQALIGIGDARGRTPGQVALAWVLDHPQVSSVIIGPDAPEHIDDALGALGWSLTSDERLRLDALSEVRKPLKIA